MEILILRVPTDDNIADIPSREVRQCRASHASMVLCFWQAEESGAMRRLGAEFVTPKIAMECDDGRMWEVLQERWSVHND